MNHKNKGEINASHNYRTKYNCRFSTVLGAGIVIVTGQPGKKNPSTPIGIAAGVMGAVVVLIYYHQL